MFNISILMLAGITLVAHYVAHLEILLQLAKSNLLISTMNIVTAQ